MRSRHHAQQFDNDPQWLVIPEAVCARSFLQAEKMDIEGCSHVRSFAKDPSRQSVYALSCKQVASRRVHRECRTSVQ